MAKIIESFLKGKNKTKLCEDGLVQSKDFIAVIDGVSSKTDYNLEGKTTGRLAMEIISGVLVQSPADAEIKDILHSIAVAFDDFYDHFAFPYDQATFGLQAVMALYSNYHQKVWLIGDCQLMVNGEATYIPKDSDQVLESLRSLVYYILEKAEPKKSRSAINQEARRVIEPWISRATIFANDPESPWGYAVINGKEIPNNQEKFKGG